MMSAPVHNAQVGTALKYQAVTSEPGAAHWVVEQGPHGAEIEQGGQLSWTPTAGQAGDQAFKISAEVNGHTVTQEFTVTAASTILETSSHVDPVNPNGASIVVDAPLSPVSGAALQIEPGSLPPGDSVAVTISSMAHAPTPPAAMIGGMSPNDLHPVELGPSGMAFKAPARLQLPIPKGLMAQPAIALQTYDYDTGHWKKVKVLNVDKMAGVVTAQVQHFSTYVLTPDIKVFDLQLGLGGAGSHCSDSLIVRAGLLAKFSDVPALGVNGFTGPGIGKTVNDVLTSMKDGEALQVYLRVHARAAGATGEQTGWMLAAATKTGGKFKVSVTSDSHAGAFLNVPAAPLAATDPELLGWLNGSRVDFVFGALGALNGGAIASAEASLYLVPAGSANQPPPASANAIATDEVEVKDLAPMAFDDDCDGAPNAYDAQPNGASPPVLVGLPQSPVHVAVGAEAIFKISSPQQGVTFKWSTGDPSVTFIAASEGTHGIATIDKPGLHHVTVTGTVGDASAIYSWDIIADPAEVAAANTAPFVAIAASANVVRAGEPVKLTALGKDAEQSALTFAWTASDATVLSSPLGENLVFSSMVPGDYVVTCLASDGSLSSKPATVTITVLSATANRPPGMPSVSPISAALMHDGNAPVSLVITAKADDADGDALTYDFAPDPSTPPTFTLTKSGAAATFSTTQNGSYVFYVTATDPNGARSPWATVKLLVLPTIAATAADVDKDGFPAGFDCNDNDPAIRPGAAEICGDGKDQDCDGKDISANQCDGDGDRFSPAQGDCNDKNPAISPQMPERCDGIDNNCNDKIDESFDVGVDCKNGMGACQVAAKTVCSASFGAVVCGGTPGAPKTETCDGVDNDCNGRVDDVPGELTGDTRNCGGCNIACPALANSVPACIMGGCSTTCAAGYVDADRRPDNGCECKLTNGGKELCDGIDNDCNGAIDEGVGMQTYTGPAGTNGVGICAAGIQYCRDGELVTERQAMTPSAEICDGLDNDCNGKVDDGFDIMTDTKNCGGCGIICQAGAACTQGRCPGGPVVGPDGGIPGAMLATCQSGGQTVCIDIGSDPANCGGCGRACTAGQYCYNGICTAGGATINCPQGQRVCTESSNPSKVYCAEVCATSPDGGAPSGGTGGAGATGSVDAGGSVAGDCPANAGFICAGAQGSTYCTDVTRDPSNCGSCGHSCVAGEACVDMTCRPSGGTGTECGGGLAMCNGVCTSIQDDIKNCGACNSLCDGSCNNGQCMAPGQAPFGSMCSKNADCSGLFCIDQARFGWPMGFCSSLCDANRQCPAGQACVGSPSSGAFGMCRQACTTDASCGRSGLVCSGGTCAPDCRTSPVVCQGTGQVCDTGTGRCVTGGTQTCQAPQMACPTGDARGTYCTEPTKDPSNCGGCGRICQLGVACNNGVCGGQVTCNAPFTSCSDGRGGTRCTDTQHDQSNCGACGTACPANAICTAGKCEGGGGSYPGLAACTASGGAPMCTNLYSDPANCGACGIRCATGQTCNGGICGTLTQPACLSDTKECVSTDGKAYCAPVRSDPNNCGACGRVCAPGQGCYDGQCMNGGTNPDGGATMTCPTPNLLCQNAADGGQFCANVQYDRNNCGTCNRICAANEICNGGSCQAGGTGTCSAPDLLCKDVTGKDFCAPVRSDRNNCGNCGKVCAATDYCMNGVCQPGAVQGDAGTCAANEISCGGRCVDRMKDTNNCGSCGFVCQAGYYCAAGACQPQAGQPDGGTGLTCTPPMVPCDNAYCTDFKADRNNCGGCHIVCKPGDYCNAGICQLG